jgi:hypothetical protein
LFDVGSSTVVIVELVLVDGGDASTWAHRGWAATVGWPRRADQ